MTIAEIIRDALLRVSAIDAVDPTPPELEELGRVHLNAILNLRNARQADVYAVSYPEFTTTPSLSPHTIGPTGTWVTNQRPVAIIGANQYQGSGTGLVKLRINMRDRQWWLSQTTPNVTGGVVTDLYYEPDWPNGNVYLWLVPNAAVTIQLETRVVLTEIAADELTTTFSLPPGYQLDLTTDLAIDLSGSLTLPVPDSLVVKQREARGAVQANNNPSVRIKTAQAGVPNQRGGDDFNWISRSWN